MKLEWDEAWFRKQLFLQKDILAEAAAYAKPHGKVYYMTCSVLEEENMEQVTRFLTKKGPEFSLLHHETIWPKSRLSDGFFLAILERNGGEDSPSDN